MRQFFKYLLASTLGVIIGSGLLVLIGVAAIAALVATATTKETVSVLGHSVLRLRLNKGVSDQAQSGSFSPLGGFQGGSLGLRDATEAIRRAKNDPKIDGLYLDLSFTTGAGFASLEALHRAIVDFKESDKFVYAYGEVLGQGAYFLASAADSVFLNPMGEVAFNGFASEVMFVKGLLDKLDITANIFKVGTYKSAIEPLINTQMSEANRRQTASYLNSIYDHYLMQVGKGRNRPADSLRAVSNRLLVRDPATAVQHGLVDRLAYEDEVLELMAKRSEAKTINKIRFVELQDYIDGQVRKPNTGDQVAVAYLQGNIVDGNAGTGQIGSKDAVKLLRKLRLDKDVKAVVLRVNSPGGSGLASEQMWRELVLLDRAKPLVVSMGDVAASGGYYIAAPARRIFAEPTTITGSIGVFGVLPTLDKFYYNKLGITFDRVKTSEYADFGSPNRPLSEMEKRVIQRGVEQFYDTFLTRVAVGRKLAKTSVDSIAQGRVYSGNEALALKLVDEIGSLEDAIASAAKMANISGKNVEEYPKTKKAFEQALEDLKEMTMTKMFGEQMLTPELAETVRVLEQLQRSRIQALMLGGAGFKN